MTDNWMDSLAALRAAMPDAKDENAADAAQTEQADDTAPARRERVCVAYERKGRGGKQATIIYGFTCSDDELQSIASHIKKRLATGGSARDGEILIQGDRRKDVAAVLKELGYNNVAGI